MEHKAQLILLSDSVFDAVSEKPFSGYIAIAEDRIIDVGKGSVPEELCDEHTRIINCLGRTITPGLIDVHCFFTGYVVRFLGEDLSGCQNEKKVFEKLNGRKDPILAHGLRFDISRKSLDARYPNKAVILFHEGCETCSMNSKAIDDFHFVPERCYPEAYVGIFPYILGDHPFIKKQFIDYMHMMNANGITSVKEMGFDDFYTVELPDPDLSSLKLQESEVAEVRWASLNEVRQMLTDGTFVPYVPGLIELLWQVRDNDDGAIQQQRPLSE